VLFVDDDDVPTPTLFKEHIRAHETYPNESYAVLGLTKLASDVGRDVLMHFVTEVGGYLSSYGNLTDGDILDYSYFWGGRTSCKRILFEKAGVFNPVFRFGCEDIELGYRMTACGLRVVFDARAVSTMIRTISFDSFCGRVRRQGQSQYLFYRLHPVEAIARWSQVDEAADKWPSLRDRFDVLVERGRVLDKMALDMREHDMQPSREFISVVHAAYWSAFDACKYRGIYDLSEPSPWSGEDAGFCDCVCGTEEARLRGKGRFS
jgi:hypothetical protein